LGTDARSIEDIETERNAYRELQRNGKYCDHVLKCYEVDNPNGLVLERCKETVRRWIRSRSSDYSPRTEAIRLAMEAAKGLAYVHSCGIVQGDVGCHNMLLDYQGSLKLADFAGSSVGGSEATVDYEAGSKLPGESEPSIKSDIFALGSAIYEMITGRPPYKGRPYTEVQRLFKQGRFPQDFDPIPELRFIVEKCWGKGKSSYCSADQVHCDLYALGPQAIAPIKSHFHPNKRAAKVVQHTKQLSPQRDFAVDAPPGQPYVNSSRNKKRPQQYYDRDKEKRIQRRTYLQNQFAQFMHSLLPGYSRISATERRHHH